MQISGVWVTTLPAADVAATVQWYRDVLGLWQAEDLADAVEAGDQRLAFAVDAGPGTVVSLRVLDLDAAVEELRTAGTTVGEPVDDGTVRQVELRDPAGNLLRLVEPAPTDQAERIERQLTEFIEGTADLAGAPVDDLADAVEAVVARAQEEVRGRMTGAAHNKVLATHLLLSQRARQVEPGSPAQWRLSAASTLLSDLIVPG